MKNITYILGFVFATFVLFSSASTFAQDNGAGMQAGPYANPQPVNNTVNLSPLSPAAQAVLGPSTLNSTGDGVDPKSGTGALIQCGNSDASGKISNPCDFGDFIGTLNRIINWIIKLSFIIFTLTFIYGGYLYVTSGLKPGNKDKAKTVLWSTFSGFIILILAWLIIHTILVYLVDEGSGYESIFKFIGGRNG
jgi:hypothetical protein